MRKTLKPYSIHRGTIIVDSSALFYLFCPVADEHMNRHVQADKRAAQLDAPVTRIRHYLGALDYLAEQGYHIIVPEMVAAETSNVLACGTSLYEHSGLPEKQRPKLYDAQLVSLLRRGIRGKPNMSLVELDRATDPDAIASQQALDKLREVLSHPEGSQEARNALIAWRKDQENRHLGEKAILGFINDAGLCERNDVFVLSNDKNALMEISQKTGVAVMNCNGFMRAITGSGLGKAMGLTEKAAVRDIMRTCAKYQENKVGFKKEPNYSWIDCRNKTGIFDHNPEGKDAFRSQMDALSEALNTKSWAQKSRLPTVNLPEDRQPAR
jgi:hypothetical protein